MNIDVFISHKTETSLHVAEAIANKLESKGIKCWYAPRDTVGPYAGSIADAIKECRVFVLILNKASSKSVHVLNELNMITERLANEEAVDIIPFHTADTDISDDARYYIGRMHWIDAMTPPLEKRIDELCSRIRNILDVDRAAALSVADKKEDTYYLLNSNMRASNCFVGRQLELNQLDAILTSRENKVFLVAMGGMGKSEIAKMYCQTHSENYDTVVWVPSMDSIEETISNDNVFPICGISRQDFLNESSHEYFMRKLNVLKMIADKKTLIVFDNFDVDTDKDLEALCSGDYALLFTSRNHHISDNIPEITVEPMSGEEQFTLFTSIYKRTLSRDGEESVKKLLRLLDSHPLSISLVASTMSANRIKPEAMIEILTSNQNSNAAQTVFERLRQVMGLANLDDREVYLMKNLSLIPIQGIEVEKLYQWCGMEDYGIIDELIKRSWIIHNPETDAVHLHPIVKDIFFDEFLHDPDSCNVLLENFNKECLNVTGKSFTYKQMLFNYANHIHSLLPKDHELYENIIISKAQMLVHMSSYEESVMLYKKILSDMKSSENKSILYRSVVHSCYYAGLYEECLEYAKEGLAFFANKDLDEMTYEEIYSYKEILLRIAEVKRASGEIETAVDYAQKAYDISEKYISEADMYNSLAWARYHLARVLFMRGKEDDIEKSENLILEGIEICIDRNDIYTVNYCRELLGQILMEKNQFEEALNLTKEVYQAHMKQIAPNHFGMAVNNIFMGNIYRKMGKENDSDSCYRRAVEILKKSNNRILASKAEEILASGKVGYLS